MNRQQVLDAAARAVLHDRAKAHGNPEDTFDLIAQLWSAYIGVEFEPHDVAAMMVLFKLGRIRGNPQHFDSWVDVAGYSACGSELASK